MLAKFKNRTRRHAKVRKQVSGNTKKPRLAVYRSNKHIFVQLIDDTTGKTLASANDLKIQEGTKTQRAEKVWADIAKKANDAKVTNIVFDKWGFKYHGRVKALADWARSSGLTF